MAEFARFLGIQCAFCNDTESAAHFHAHYNQHSAVIDIKTGGVVGGSVPPRVAALLSEWVLINNAVLTENWVKLKAGNPNLTRVPPLVE